MEDSYIDWAEVEVEIYGAMYRARVHIALIEGRAACVGLELLGFTESIVDTGDDGPFLWRNLLPGTEALTARRLRGLRLDPLVEAAKTRLSGRLEALVDYRSLDFVDEMGQSRARQTREALDSRQRATRPPLMTESELMEQVVAPYENHVRAGGRSPVMAVKAALTEARGGELVSRPQAEWAVRRARKLGLLKEKR